MVLAVHFISLRTLGTFCYCHLALNITLEKLTVNRVHFFQFVPVI